MNHPQPKFLFFGHEALFARAGLFLYPEHMTPHDVVEALKEIEELYKHKYKFDCVKAVRNRNDPLMADVYVVPKGGGTGKCL